MILFATLIGIASGAAAMLPPLLRERRHRQVAEGRLALVRAADPTAALLSDVGTFTEDADH